MSISTQDALNRIAYNLAAIAGAIATLAEAVNGTYKGKPIYTQPTYARDDGNPATIHMTALARIRDATGGNGLPFANKWARSIAAEALDKHAAL
jgi:hypothetical protein